MTNTEHRNLKPGGGGYIVRRPRVTDALGITLREAYATASALPDELAEMVAMLDGLAPRH